MSNRYELPTTPCPHCGALHNSIKAIGYPRDDDPREGDISVCIKCATPVALAADLSLRKLTDLELAEINGDADLRHTLEMMIRAIQKNEPQQ